MKKRIHINQHELRKNLKDGGYRPCITVKTYKQNVYGHEVEILGPSKLVYPERPLSCGARIWIETEGQVIVHNRDKQTLL